MKRSVMLVDDDQKLRLLLKTYLEKNQFSVRLSHDGASFQLDFEKFQHEIGLVILDVMLPDTDGFTLCRWVRKISNIPVIMLTASADDTDRIVGLELGADDYIGKPYNPRELLARIKAIQRRSGVLSHTDAGVPRYWRFEGWTLDVTERRLSNPEGCDLGPLDRSLDVQISRLRQRLQDDGKQAAMIKTVRGSGYAFTAQVQCSPE
jgi:DNA-binding response OmpR family regulator